MSSSVEILPTESTCDVPLNILSEVNELKDEIFANRRWFHSFPELSFKEFNTAKKVSELLSSYGITEIFEGVAITGVVALIRGSAPGPCIALRADMDGLPVIETAEIPYRSQHEVSFFASCSPSHNPNPNPSLLTGCDARMWT